MALPQNTVSSTALLIAKALVFLSHDERFSSLIPETTKQASAWFIEDLAPDKSFLKRVRKPYYRFFLRTMERLMVPGTILHFALRKRFFEQQARDSISKGIRQVVILAGGLDTLAFRLHLEYPEVQFFEIDRIESQNAKKKVLQERATIARNYHFLGADLAHEPLDKILAHSPHYNPDAPTLYLVEGVTMYLPEASVRKLLEFIQSTMKREGKFVFTYIRNISPKRDFSAKLSDTWLAKRKEKYQWSISDDALKDLLQGHKMNLIDQKEYAALQQPHVSATEFRTLKKVRGEHMAVAALM
jgi:methyltransferase (TIGR00027 family)